MNKITLTKEVKRGGIDYAATFDVVEHGCTVAVCGIEREVDWESMNDAEFLSDIFGDIPVFLFKVVVETLGQVFNKQDAYIGLV